MPDTNKDMTIEKAFIQSLPNYNKNAKCEKCGDHKADSEFTKGEAGEYQKRTCTNCGFVWKERCLDVRQK